MGIVEVAAFCDASGRRPPSHNHGDAAVHQISRKCRQPIIMTLRPSELDRNVSVFNVAGFITFIVIHRWDSFSCALAAHDSESRRWADGVDRRICQTFAASPAEPGGLLLAFSDNVLEIFDPKLIHLQLLVQNNPYNSTSKKSAGEKQASGAHCWVSR